MTSSPPEVSDVTYKVLLLGDTGVGKTSLIRSLTGKTFSHNMLTTVGVDFVKHTFVIDGAKVCLQIWDTAGQERFRSITRFQYRGTKGLLLVYDVTSRSSFDMLDYWLDSIRQEVDQSNKEPVPVIIIGNKCDLDDQRVVRTEEGERVCQRDFQTAFFETSAATSLNVRQCFETLAHAITDLNNPQVMKTYRYSAAMDKGGGKDDGASTSNNKVDQKRVAAGSPAGQKITAPASSKSPGTGSTNKPFKLHAPGSKKSSCSCAK